MSEFGTSLIHRFKALIVQVFPPEPDFALTGIPNVDVQVLAKVDNVTLNTICQRCTYTKRLYQQDPLWYTKAELEFGNKILQHKSQTISAKDFYMGVRRVYAHMAAHGAKIVLLDGAKNNNLMSVGVVLYAGTDVDAADEYGLTALMYAAERGHSEIVKELMQRNVNINAHDVTGYTALIGAAGNGHSEIVHELVLRGAHMNAADMIGNTALIQASRRGHVKVVHELLRAGADVNVAAIHGYTALMLAADSGHFEVVQELLRAGANVNAATIHGHTALMYTALNGDYDIKILKALLEAGAHTQAVDRHRYTALEWAKEGTRSPQRRVFFTLHSKTKHMLRTYDAIE